MEAWGAVVLATLAVGFIVLLVSLFAMIVGVVMDWWGVEKFGVGGSLIGGGLLILGVIEFMVTGIIISFIGGIS